MKPLYLLVIALLLSACIPPATFEFDADVDDTGAEDADPSPLPGESEPCDPSIGCADIQDIETECRRADLPTGIVECGSLSGTLHNITMQLECSGATDPICTFQPQPPFVDTSQPCHSESFTDDLPCALDETCAAPCANQHFDQLCDPFQRELSCGVCLGSQCHEAVDTTSFSCNETPAEQDASCADYCLLDGLGGSCSEDGRCDCAPVDCAADGCDLGQPCSSSDDCAEHVVQDCVLPEDTQSYDILAADACADLTTGIAVQRVYAVTCAPSDANPAVNICTLSGDDPEEFPDDSTTCDTALPDGLPCGLPAEQCSAPPSVDLCAPYDIEAELHTCQAGSCDGDTTTMLLPCEPDNLACDAACGGLTGSCTVGDAAACICAPPACAPAGCEEGTHCLQDDDCADDVLDTTCVKSSDADQPCHYVYQVESKRGYCELEDSGLFGTCKLRDEISQSTTNNLCEPDLQEQSAAEDACREQCIAEGLGGGSCWFSAGSCVCGLVVDPVGCPGGCGPGEVCCDDSCVTTGTCDSND